MPRTPRKKSKTGIFHIMARGVNKELIFRDDEDRRQFLRIMLDLRKDVPFVVYAFCLMANHVHILAYFSEDNLSYVMSRLWIRYALYYNAKYGRVGHLIQNRFRSEPVETDEYFFIVVRYIHQNPVKAGMVESINDYVWSSHKIYIGERTGFSDLVDTEFVLNMFSDEAGKRLINYIKFMDAENNDSCLDVEQPRLSDDQLKSEIIKLLGGRPMEELSLISSEERRDILKQVKLIKGTSIRQIAKVSGINRGIVHRI